MPRCFILLGGQGTRLLPLTNWIHKAMIPLCGKPILEYIILNLRRHNIRDIVFCSNPRTAEQFTNYFGNGSRFGVKIRYSIGKQSLNTAGRILNAKNWIDDTFIVYYGDVLSDVNLLKVFDFHKSKDGIGTIVLSPMLPTAVGITKVGRDGRISEVKEKPLLSYPTNMGIYILEPKILRYIDLNMTSLGTCFQYCFRMVRNYMDIFQIENGLM